MPLRLIVASATVAALLAFASLSATQAQTPAPPPPLQNGDIVWAFGQENPLFDERIATALGTLIAPQVEAAAPSVRVVRVQQREPGVFAPGTIQPASDVPKLLAAAGYGNTPPFVEVGQCKMWVVLPPGVSTDIVVQ